MAENSRRTLIWKKIGAVMTKGISLRPKAGNPTPRIAENLLRDAQCDWFAERRH